MTSYEVAPGEEIKIGALVRFDKQSGCVSRAGIQFGRDGAAAWDGAVIGEDQIPLVDVIHYRLGTEPPVPVPVRMPTAADVARKEREDIRRGIDLLLAEDARRTPAFATARRAAALAAAEGRPRVDADKIDDVIYQCHLYEGDRGGGRAPSEKNRRHVGNWGGDAAMMDAFAAYERARGMP